MARRLAFEEGLLCGRRARAAAKRRAHAAAVCRHIKRLQCCCRTSPRTSTRNGRQADCNRAAEFWRAIFVRLTAAFMRQLLLKPALVCRSSALYSSMRDESLDMRVETLEQNLDRLKLHEYPEMT